MPGRGVGKSIGAARLQGFRPAGNPAVGSDNVRLDAHSLIGRSLSISSARNQRKSADSSRRHDGRCQRLPRPPTGYVARALIGCPACSPFRPARADWLDPACCLGGLSAWADGRPGPPGRRRLGLGARLDPLTDRRCLISAPLLWARRQRGCRSGRWWLLLARELFGPPAGGQARGNGGHRVAPARPSGAAIFSALLLLLWPTGWGPLAAALAAPFKALGLVAVLGGGPSLLAGAEFGRLG